ncbi:histidine kinase family protein [Rhodococcus sp. MTM3W5.2]|uniref:sensor histidine kinase n=1 Tax=Rhodococcus sp. MTM3W5.2 TaxID=1805827 RepID=UPI0009796E7D|nr:histidine kinase [Rhodococcus sp. MTM3W5.2]AQA24803.1 histidine kinase family protein [Rhodococcus sp. MTM3W5.2]
MTALEEYRRRLEPRLPWIRDIALLAATIFVLVGRFVQAGDHSAQAFWLSAISVAAAMTLWWRRRYPIAITCLGILVCALSGSNLMMLIAICTLAVRRRDRWLWILAVAGALTDATSTFFRRPGEDYPTALGSTLFAVAAFAVLGAYIGLRRAYLDGLHDRVRQAEAEREARAAQARLAERSRIAREMHDVVAHKVSLIALHAGALQLTRAPDADRVQRSATLIADTARGALEDLRGVLGVLRDSSDEPAPEPPQPLLRDIPALIAASRAAGVPIVEDIRADLERPAPSVLAHAAFRVTQEALTNIHKHAAGAATTIAIHGAPGDRLSIEIVNAAAPAESSATTPLDGSGTGLEGLRERVTVAAGTFEHGPTADGGFRVFASSPWPNGQPDSPSN